MSLYMFSCAPLTDVQIVIFSTRQHTAYSILYMLSALYAIARTYVCLSIRWVDHWKTVEVRIM